MSDIALVMSFDATGVTSDLVVSGGDLLMDDGLETAVRRSLFEDRRVSADDPKLTPGDGRRGWWADMYPAVVGDKTGSRLWLLAREKNTADIPGLAVEYATEALRWMIDDGVTSEAGLTVTAAFASSDGVRQDVLNISISIARPSGQTTSFKYFYQWAAQALLSV